MSAERLDGFDTAVVDVGDTTIFVRRRGSGPPVLLLHGFPETHLMWHRVAPALAQEFTVVCADLRGYGCSGKPVSQPDHAPYSKRSMALDMVRAMETLGMPRFAVVGHDRGGRVAYRLAIDHPDRVARTAVLDIIPTAEALRRVDSRLALAFWPWSLLSQPVPLPERLIASAPEAVVDDALTNWGSDPTSVPADVRAAYTQALRDPDTVHAVCEEYRAAATIDVTHDNEDYASGRRIDCPLLVLWAEGGSLDTWYQQAGGPLGIWARWAVNVTGRAIHGGHFFPEENPVDTVSELRAFLRNVT
jgi:haloacetate dehalogenase